jgi:hypothetical protein
LQLSQCNAGLPDFSWSKHTKTGKIYQMTVPNYTKWTLKIKVYQHFLFQAPPKFTQIGIFGKKIKKTSGNPGGSASLLSQSITSSQTTRQCRDGSGAAV